MKNYLIIFLLIFANTSCKKRYSCRCSSTLTFPQPNRSSIQGVYQPKTTPISEKMTKKQAKEVCDHEGKSINQTYMNLATNNGTQPAGFSSSTVCKLE